VWPQAVRNGVLDRAALADIVFSDPSARERLNALLHPHIRRVALERETHAKPGQIVVHVVPLLFETGYDRLVDKSVLVVASLEQRIARVVARDKLDEARVRARIAAQIEPGQARKAADFIIENDGNLNHLQDRARAVFEALEGTPTAI
jgi:dephospho-CoA kinase